MLEKIRRGTYDGFVYQKDKNRQGMRDNTIFHFAEFKCNNPQSSFELLNVKREDLIACLLELNMEGSRNDLSSNVLTALKTYLGPMLNTKEAVDIIEQYHGLEDRKKEFINTYKSRTQKNVEDDWDMNQDSKGDESGSEHSIDQIDYDAALSQNSIF